MSWQPGDVSQDARRAAEAAAEAAGVPLKDWFAETVRAAILRELGRIPAEEPEAEPAARTRETLEREPPPAEPVLSLSTQEPDQPPVPEPPMAATAALASALAAATEPSPPPPTGEPEPLTLDPAAAVEPPVLSSIAEPEPLAPESIAAATPIIVTPETPDPARDPRVIADHATRRGSPEPQRRADSFSTWLATRIQGLPTRSAPAIPSVAAPMPSPPIPVSAPAPQPPLGQPGPYPATTPARPASTSEPPRPAQAEAAPPQPPLPPSLPTGPITILSLASLRPAPVRARHPLGADPAIAALAASVASQGVREPILVRHASDGAGQYEVVAGERRRLAAERAGRADLPAVIVEADDVEALQLSLMENLGRGDFSPLDEARAYLRLLTEFRVSPSALAQRLARERPHIALALRLLGLPPKVRELIDSGRLAPAEAYALLDAPDAEAMAERMIQAAGGAARDPA